MRALHLAAALLGLATARTVSAGTDGGSSAISRAEQEFLHGLGVASGTPASRSVRLLLPPGVCDGCYLGLAHALRESHQRFKDRLRIEVGVCAGTAAPSLVGAAAAAVVVALSPCPLRSGESPVLLMSDSQGRLLLYKRIGPVEEDQRMVHQEIVQAFSLK